MSKWHPHTLGQLPYAVERLDGVLLDEALGGCLDPDEGFFGRHVAHHLLGGEQLDEAQLDEAQLVFAAVLDSSRLCCLAPPQWARLECGAIWQSCF